MERVVVIGGGIGGVEAAISLASKGFDTLLISERDSLWIYPTSIWVGTGEMDPSECTLDLGEVAKKNRFEFLRAKVEKIDSSASVVKTDAGEVKFDRLVIATGGVKTPVKGIENTLSTCGSPEEMVKIGGRFKELLKRGEGTIALGFGGNPKDPTGVRGGPVFEMLFNYHYLLKKKGLRDRFRLVFFAPMPKPGARLGEKNAERLFKFFDKLGIEYKVGVKIKEFQEDGILFEDGEKLQTDLTIFTPALSGHPLYKSDPTLPLNEAGFIKIDERGAVLNSEGRIWAVGDAAAIEGPPWIAKQGHLAEVMGRIVARNLKALVEGKSDFESYKKHLHIVCLMDMGPWGGIFFARTPKRIVMLPLPKVGHWLKKLWGWYYKASKLKKIPRIPGFDAP